MTENTLSSLSKSTVTAPASKENAAKPFAALRGTGNKQFTTEQIMRMARGDD